MPVLRYLTCFVKTKWDQGKKELGEVKSVFWTQDRYDYGIIGRKRRGWGGGWSFWQRFTCAIGLSFFLLRILKRCLVKEQDSGRRKELEEMPLTLLWAGSSVSYASLPKDKAAQAGYTKNWEASWRAHELKYPVSLTSSLPGDWHWIIWKYLVNSASLNCGWFWERASFSGVLDMMQGRANYLSGVEGGGAQALH